MEVGRGMFRIAHKAGTKAITIIILIAAGWNLISHSSDTNVSLSDVKFIATGGTEYTWANAVSNDKVRAYLAYYDSSSATASERKFKYVSAVSGADDTELRKGKGYWLYADVAGNLTIPSVGGSTSGQTYDWDKLRFSNGTEEMNVTDAGDADWIDHDNVNYWDSDLSGFVIIASVESFNAWQGYFVYSNVDNLTLIRQN